MKKAFSRKNLWENAPPFVKRTVGAALGLVPQPYLLGKHFRRWWRLVNESQKWPAERLREHQLAQLKTICALAYEKTAFYKRAFAAAGFHPNDLKSPEDLRGLPTIDKSALRDHLEEMCAVAPDSPGMDYVSTGGTSGAPLRFYINAGRSAPEYAHLAAGWFRAGYSFKVPQAVLRGQVVAPDRNGFRHQYDPILRRHYYSNFHTTDEDLRKYLEHVATLGPCFLHVYPSSVAALGRFLERNGLKPPANVRGILAGSENVYPEDRAAAERIFGVRYFTWYGHSEKLVLAAECEHSTDYHVWPTYGYFELLDDTGKPVTTPGQRGEIVGTGFINTVVPFIRYRTGDYATYVGPRCKACGREHPLVNEVRGHRTQEMLVASDRALIGWTALNMHDDTFERVRQFQFYQTRPGLATLRIVPASGFGDEDVERIQRNLNRKLAGRLAFDVQIVDEIRLTAQGKSVFVDQKIDLTKLEDGRSGEAKQILDFGMRILD